MKKDIRIEHMKLYKKKGKTFAIYVRHANCKFTASMISLILYFFIPIMFSLRHDVFFIYCFLETLIHTRVEEQEEEK